MGEIERYRTFELLTRLPWGHNVALVDQKKERLIQDVEARLKQNLLFDGGLHDCWMFLGLKIEKAQ